MKWIFVVFGLFWQLPLQAAEQYSQFVCDNLEDRLEFIQKRTSSGYDINASSSTTAKDFALMQEYNSHCQHPVDTVRVIRGAIQESQTANYADTQLQDMPSLSGNNATYHGEKADAWEDFYQVSRLCRKKQLTEAQFIWCAEHKAEQRAKFEHEWQIAVAANTATSALTEATSIPTVARVPQVISNDSTTPVQSAANAENPPLLQYWQALDEQNQRFKWYGLVMLLLMVIAGWLTWRN